jgi:hypothetical protein
MNKLVTLVLVFSCAVCAVPVMAQPTSNLDYVGFAWETGGVLPSNPGDVLCVSAVGTAIDPIFGVPIDANNEVTIYLSGLVSTGEIDMGSYSVIAYVAGHIEVYADSPLDHDWGVNPPNAELSTFLNGSLLFEGDFTDFTLFLTDAEAGSYQGNIDGIGGTIAEACVDCAYTFGGAFGKGAGAQLPVGYDLQIDGTLEVLDSVPNGDTSWGAVKALY